MNAGRGSGRELTLWAVSAAIVIAAHGGIAAALAAWTEISDPSGSTTAILVEMAPVAQEAAAQQANLPVGPPQEEQTEPEPKPEPEKTEPEPEQKVVEAPPVPDPPPQSKAEVTLPPEPPKEVKPPPPKKAAVATAPERAERIAPHQMAARPGVARVSPNVIASYAASVIRPHLLRYYNYPPSARAKNEEGVVVVTFTITRQGKLTARNISKSSGYAELDSEALATLQRAQPFPPPPPDLTQPQFVFTLPMRYNIR